jgi:hypothetical protein
MLCPQFSFIYGAADRSAIAAIAFQKAPTEKTGASDGGGDRTQEPPIHAQL